MFGRKEPFEINRHPACGHAGQTGGVEGGGSPRLQKRKQDAGEGLDGSGTLPGAMEEQFPAASDRRC